MAQLRRDLLSRHFTGHDVYGQVKDVNVTLGKNKKSALGKRKRKEEEVADKRCFANAEETPYLQMAICGALHIEVQCSPFSRAEVCKILQYIEAYQEEHKLGPMPIILCGFTEASSRMARNQQAQIQSPSPRSPAVPPSRFPQPCISPVSSTDSSSSGDDEAGTQTVSEEVESPVDDEQQQSVPEPMRRPRKPKTTSKWPTDMIEVTEIHPDGKPIEVKQQRRLRLLARLIARQQLSLVMPSFKNLTNERKWELFNKHVMPYLKFPDTMKTEGLKYIMEVIYKSWRTHKNRLVTDFIEKNLSPFQKHPYIQPEDWAEFEVLKKSPEEIAKSEKYKMLRQQNVHNHCLGSAGYDGKEKKWEVEDAELVKKGIPNPWDDYPEGCPVRFLRARSKLEVSEDKAEIIWKQDSTQKISEDIKEKQSAAESLGVTWVRENDVLTACLGPKQPGRVRTISSYTGWKHGWPGCSGMYRKRKRSGAVDVDVEAIAAQVRQEVTAQVTQEVSLRPRLVEGRVFPKEFVLESVQIDYDYAIVQVECVHQGYEDYVLQPPPNDDIKTLREALLQRIQWRRDWIIVKQTHETQPTQSQPDETTKRAKSVSKGTNAIISTKLLCGANSTPSNHQSPATSDATKSVPKEHNTANPSKNPNNSEKECTKLPTQPKVGTEAVGSGARPPKQPKGASKAAGESEKAAINKKLASKAVGQSLKQPQQQKWIDKYKCGHPFLPAMDLKAVGPGCTALHAHYMKDCVNNKHGIVVWFRGIYMLNSSNFEVGLVRYNFLYDLFQFGALDASLLQCWILSLVVEAKAKDIHVGFLDPQVMSLDNITFDRDKVLQAFARHTNKLKDRP
ncbi:unnamed protein product [Miscanthus lutarioriparius]|uniref:DUF8039 domain-containing protein n=1 Tax=Miscanthus lutarioriparius TaxID=422564 RepID=A0A811SHS0_9POAL|nr:unnamed protein product [Miscanthus lutarioriparius]